MLIHLSSANSALQSKDIPLEILINKLEEIRKANNTASQTISKLEHLQDASLRKLERTEAQVFKSRKQLHAITARMCSLKLQSSISSNATLHYTFSFLTPFELGKCAGVCKQWGEVAPDIKLHIQAWARYLKANDHVRYQQHGGDGASNKKWMMIDARSILTMRRCAQDMASLRKRLNILEEVVKAQTLVTIFVQFPFIHLPFFL